MDYVILIGVVAVLAITGFIGYKQGMIKILLPMVATVVTYILAAALTLPVSAMLKTTTPIYNTIEESVSDMVEESMVDSTSIEELNLPVQIEEQIMEGATTVTDSFNKYLVETLSDLIFKALTFFVLFIVIYIILCIVIKVFDFVGKLPLIKNVNQTGGLIIGLVQGLMIVWLGCLVITAFGDKAWAQEAFRQINNNALLTFIYENNPIIYLITKFI